MHADPDVQVEGRIGKVPQDPERRSHGSRRVVLVRRRCPEDPDHGVADELLDDSAVGLDDLPSAAVVRGHEPVDVLGIEALGELRRAHDIAEQRRDDFALDVALWAWRRRRGQRRGRAFERPEAIAAVVAEPRRTIVRGPTGRADAAGPLHVASLR